MVNPSAALTKSINSFDHTRSFRLFSHSLSVIDSLLRYGIAGLDKGIEQVGSLAARIDATLSGQPIPMLPRALDEQLVTITLTEEDATLVKEALQYYEESMQLHSNLYAILLVALWSSAESYFQGIVVEVFTINPHELGTDKTVTYRDLVEHKDSPIELLIEREVSDFGHLPLEQMLKYITLRLKFTFSETELAVLKEVYFLRNIIAHNSGFVRKSQEALLPDGIGIKRNQVDIPLQYLHDRTTGLAAGIEKMDSYIMQRWRVPFFHGALFDEPGYSLSDRLHP
jgi:hypothetical protein